MNMNGSGSMADNCHGRHYRLCEFNSAILSLWSYRQLEPMSPKVGQASWSNLVKAAPDVYAPVDGSISEVNEALSSDPALVNTAAESDGWLYKITLTDPSQLESLMDRDADMKLIA